MPLDTRHWRTAGGAGDLVRGAMAVRQGWLRPPVAETGWKGRQLKISFAIGQWRRFGVAVGVLRLAERLVCVLKKLLERMGVIRVDGRLNVTISWAHPLAVPVVVALFPLGFLASVAFRVYLWRMRHAA
ncbi:MAG: hypothetical protein KDJ47_13635 [Hyphomicrobiaceae bacterium]|nr:hypothetical protein [Hyphomicrobiaceae bacterium]